MRETTCLSNHLLWCATQAFMKQEKSWSTKPEVSVSFHTALSKTETHLIKMHVCLNSMCGLLHLHIRQKLWNTICNLYKTHFNMFVPWDQIHDSCTNIAQCSPNQVTQMANFYIDEMAQYATINSHMSHISRK